ncbi:MAG: gamma-glutamyltransferase family protein [Gammaproteobacteria bacterium]
MSLDYYPYASRRSAVLACNGVVATSQPLAAEAGLDTLRRGGNAVDAAIATAAALTVLEPTSNGLGGDAFALIWDGERVDGINGSGRWPRSMSAGQLRADGFSAVPERGWAPVSVPGGVALWHDLHERHGRLDMASLLAPAIDYARHGYPVSPVVSGLWRNAFDLFSSLDDPAIRGWHEVFARGGAAPRAGERWSSPAMAECLRRLSRRGLRDFYEGSIAEALVAYARRTGGHLGADDLASHASEWVEPVSTEYRGHTVWEMPPNGQGIAALQALGMLEHRDLASLAHAGEDCWHLQIEAMKLAFADAYRYVADPQVASVPIAGMIDPAYLASRADLIGDRAADPGPGVPPDHGTVYLCTADRNGMMVSFIQSNYMGFGSGVVVPDVGVSLHNRATGFVLEEGHRNEAEGGKRPRHTIIPGFLTKGDRALGPFGVMGGEMQPQGHLQVVSSMLDHGLNPQAALDAPRWQIGGGLSVAVESEAAGVARALAPRGHDVNVVRDRGGFGRGQIIVSLEDGVYAAGSEPRTDGCAASW